MLLRLSVADVQVDAGQDHVRSGETVDWIEVDAQSMARGRAVAVERCRHRRPSAESHRCVLAASCRRTAGPLASLLNAVSVYRFAAVSVAVSPSWRAVVSLASAVSV